MGNKSQLKILLLGGAQNWNAWRQANPDVPIDSHGEDIGHATLGIDDQASLAGEPFGNNAWSFIRAEWIGYVCWPVDFSGANLQGARLTNATGCLLATADLRGANLEHTSLNRADLSGAIGADLTGASLYLCYLSRAR